MRKEKHNLFLLAFVMIILLRVTYLGVLKELPDHLSDYNGHVYVFLPHFFSGGSFWEGWRSMPYCGFHLVTLFFYQILRMPLDDSAAYAACTFAAFSFLIFYLLIQRFAAAKALAAESTTSALLAFCLCIIQPLKAYWLDAFPYSMNPIYNPTYMCVRGFSLLCFFLVCDLWGAQRSKEYRGTFFRVETGVKKYYVLLAVLLLLSAIAKPTFAEAFIPAVAFLMLGGWLRRIVKKDPETKSYFQCCLNFLFCALPTLAYILLQYCTYFLFGESYGNGGSVVITGFMEIWKHYSQNVLLSMALSLAFPLVILLLDASFFLRSDEGRLALVCVLVGFAESALLGEEGAKFLHFNFIWPLLSAMLLLFTVSVLHLLRLEGTQQKPLWKNVLLGFAWCIFCLHVLSGLTILSF